MSESALLSVEDLRVRFWTSRGLVHAVNGITFDVRPGESLPAVQDALARLVDLGLVQLPDAAGPGAAGP